MIHLAAIAGRLGLSLDLKKLNELSETTPVIVNLKPTGLHYMEDLAAAGGFPQLCASYEFCFTSIASLSRVRP